MITETRTTNSVVNDVTKDHELRLTIQIDQNGWECHISTRLSHLPDGATYKYRFGNASEVHVMGPNDTKNMYLMLEDLHEFVATSFKGISAIISQGRVTSTYVIDFMEDHCLVSYSDNSARKSPKWRGVMYPNQKCEPVDKLAQVEIHRFIYESINEELLSILFDRIEEEKFGPMIEDDSAGYSEYLN